MRERCVFVAGVVAPCARADCGGLVYIAKTNATRMWEAAGSK